MKQELIQKKLRDKFLKKGVKMISPETIFFSRETKIGKNVSIEPYVVLDSDLAVFWKKDLELEILLKLKKAK